MARLMYGPVAVATPTVDDGDLGPVLVAMTVYRTRTGGSPETSLLTEAGSAITTVTPDPTTGAATWQGPDGYEGSLWLADPNTGIRWEVYPNGLADRTGGVSSVTVNGGAAQTGAVALTIPDNSPEWVDVQNKPAFIGAGSTQTAARAAIAAISSSEASDLVNQAVSGIGGFVVINEGDPYPDVPVNYLVVEVAAGAAEPVFTQLYQTPQGSGLTDSTTAVTSSISPAAGSVCFLKVDSGKTGGLADYPTTVTGAGLTWTAVVSIKTSGANIASRIYIGTGTPSAGAVTATFPVSMGNALLRVIQVENVATSGTVVQAGSHTSSGTTPAVTLTGVDARNSVLGFYANNSTSQTASPNAGYAPLGVQVTTAADLPAMLTDAAYRTDGVNVMGWQAGVDPVTLNGAQKTVLAVELKAL